MIALINFEDEQVMTREEAEQLNLQYTKETRYGCRIDRTLSDIHAMDSYDFYIDEAFQNTREGEDSPRYYKDAEFTKELSNYYLYYRAPEGDWVTVAPNNHLVQLEDFVVKCSRKFYISKALPTAAGDPTSLAVAMERVTKKFDEMLASVNKLEHMQFNEKCSVHVGGGLITTYNELMLQEDMCTDVMQDLLNKGWRMIAVCVQPDQRRPDYILGRYNPNMDLHDNALRREQ